MLEVKELSKNKVHSHLTMRKVFTAHVAMI